jgi:hypothetical protein
LKLSGSSDMLGISCDFWMMENYVGRHLGFTQLKAPTEKSALRAKGKKGFMR